jgi:hypothetical protein
MVHKIHQQRLVKVGNRLTLIVPKWFYDIYLEVRDEMDKSIDLGKLQTEVEGRKDFLKRAARNLKEKETRLNIAQRSYDVSRVEVEGAEKMLDKAKRAVLEAARTVTQG